MCALLPIRAENAENAENGSQLVETLNADLRRPERHAGAVALVEHPVRELATEVRPLVCIDAAQRFAAAKWRDLQRSPEQRMPPVGDRR